MWWGPDMVKKVRDLAGWARRLVCECWEDERKISNSCPKPRWRQRCGLLVLLAAVVLLVVLVSMLLAFVVLPQNLSEF